VQLQFLNRSSLQMLIFVPGPVVVIASFASEEEAIDAANNTTYGLGSAVFTNDLKRAHRVAAEIEAGMVWINSTQDCDPRIPFGGQSHLIVSTHAYHGR